MKETSDFNSLVGKPVVVEFNRKPFTNDKVSGFLVDWNRDFVLVEVFDTEYADVDGFCVFRFKSIKTVRDYVDQEFYDEVFKLKQIAPSPRPDVQLTDWQSILRSVGEAVELTLVEFELKWKNQCNIGRITKVGKKKFHMLEIDPRANWVETPSKFRFEDLTRVAFGSHYIETLRLVSENRRRNHAGASE